MVLIQNTFNSMLKLNTSSITTLNTNMESLPISVHIWKITHGMAWAKALEMHAVDG